MHFRTSWLLPVLSIILVVSVLWFIHSWLTQLVELPAVVITSPVDPVNQLPVYAQFTVTQNINLQQTTNTTALEIPFQRPSMEAPMIIDLRHDGTLLTRWRIMGSANAKMETLHLPVTPPVVASGAIEISFSSPAVLPETREQAAHVFVEPEGASFPQGSYRIAENQKDGDVNMRVLTQTTQGDLLWAKYKDEPGQGLSLLAGIVVVLCLLADAPYIVVRSWQRLRSPLKARRLNSQ